MKDAKGEGQRWLSQAVHDLEAGVAVLNEQLWWIACFQAQQAAEKAVKAFLYASGERSVLGHSVRELAQHASRKDPGFEGLVGTGTMLDRFYVLTRYPNGLPGGVPAETYTKEDADGALDLAKKIVDFVRGLPILADSQG